MSGILTNLKNTVIAGIVLTILMILLLGATSGDEFLGLVVSGTSVTVNWLPAH